MARIDDAGWTKKNMKLHLNLNQLSNAGNGGKACAKNFLRKSIDKGNSSSCGPCLITTTRGYAKHHRTSWTRPNWKLYICACSGRSEEKTWQRNKSAAAGAFKRSHGSARFHRVFLSEDVWKCLENRNLQNQIKCYPLAHSPQYFFLLSRGYRGYPSTKSFVEVQVYGIRKQSLFKTNGQCLVDSCWISF